MKIFILPLVIAVIYSILFRIEFKRRKYIKVQREESEID